MAIQCNYCGASVPKDDAHFCNKCGMAVSSHPVNPQSLPASNSNSKMPDPSSSREQQERRKRVLREQIAELSSSRPKSGHLELDEPVNTLDMGEQTPVEPDTLQSNQSLQVSAVVEEVPLEKLPETPQPELEDDMVFQSEEVSVEDVPTVSIPAPVKKQSEVSEQDVERLPSNLPFLSVPSTQEAAQKQVVEDQRARSKVTSSERVDSPLSTSSVSSPGYQSASRPDIPPQDKAGATLPTRRPRRRWPIVIVVLLLIVLVAGGLGAAMMLSQPSGNDPVIQSQVRFSDTQSGVLLLYPNGWIKQVDPGKSTTHFYASDRIGEVDVIVTPGSGNAEQALQQQATKMGMSGKKAGAVLYFADASWQQLQGTVQVSGASYSDTILATIHGSQLFTLVQQAPQSNYADWEKEFFAPLRASFKFL